MNYATILEFRFSEGFPVIHVVYDDDGKAWFEGGPVARTAGFAAQRDAVGKVSDDHKIIIHSPGSERVTGNPQTRRVALIDLEGARQLFYRSTKRTPVFRDNFLRAAAEFVKSNPPNLADLLAFGISTPPIKPRPEPPIQPTPPIEEQTILAQAVLLANRRLQESTGIRYGTMQFYTPSEIGKRFGMSAVAVNKILHAEGVQYSIKKDGYSIWLLSKPYKNRGLAIIKSVEKNGKLIEHLFWTPAGVSFVEGILLKLGIFPLEMQPQATEA